MPTSLLVLVLNLASAWAAGPSVTASDGVVAMGVAEPAWAAWAEPVPILADAGSLAVELERAWRLRHELKNEQAAALVAKILDDLRPTFNTRDRDILQRALFLQGLLALGEAGSFEALGDAVSVGPLLIPSPWANAIAVSPGAAAPASTDARYAAHTYDEARTILTAQEGAAVDGSATGADVRIDGEPVDGVLRVLPGLHTLSYHPPGKPPMALMFTVENGGAGSQVTELGLRMAELESFVQEGTIPSDDLRQALHARLGSPAALIRTSRGSRTLWLVDGLRRFGKATVAAGISAGGALLAGDWTTTPAGCDGSDEGQKFLVPIGAAARLTVGPWRVRAGGGVMVGATDDGFATGETISCGDAELPGALNHPAYAWAGVGRRFSLGGPASMEVGAKMTATPAFAAIEALCTVPVAAGSSVGWELSLHAGGFANVWSDTGNRAGFLGGLDSTLLFGARQ